LLKSCIIPDPGRVAAYLGQDAIAPEAEPAIASALKVKEEGRAAVGLAILGFITEEKGKGSVLKGCAAAAGEGIRKTFSWEMGGDLPTLRARGAVIGLNTLRLGLL